MILKSRGETVFVIDDDPDYLMQQEIVLKSAGYEVITIDNRITAEEELTQRKPDAVIVDLMMDNNDDGFALCYLIKKRYPDIPVVLVTSVASETGIEFETETTEEKSWIKADILLQKPVRAEQILAELKRLLQEK